MQRGVWRVVDERETEAIRTSWTVLDLSKVNISHDRASWWCGVRGADWSDGKGQQHGKVLDNHCIPNDGG